MGARDERPASDESNGEPHSGAPELNNEQAGYVALGRRAAGMAHDINNLMAVILGRVELMLKNPGPTETSRDDLMKIADAASRARGLVLELLSGEGATEAHHEHSDLNGVIRNIERTLRLGLGPGIELSLILAPDLDRVRGDAAGLEQVVLNLALNARDAMPAGGRLTLETVEDHGTVVLEVRDTGLGMDAETRSNAFEPLFGTKDTGIGLGLSTVREIVIRNGGEVDVESAPGVGSTFRVRLPTTVEPAVSSDTATILVVDDEEDLRAVVGEVLEGSGYLVLLACSGSDAIEKMKAHDGRIDLLVTDLSMPEMTGRELAYFLAPRNERLKVLIISGLVHDDFAMVYPPDRSTAFLQKPFTPAELLEAVRSVLTD